MRRKWFVFGIVSLIILSFLLLTSGFVLGAVSTRPDGKQGWICDIDYLKQPYPEILEFSPKLLKHYPGQQKIIKLEVTGNDFLSNNDMNVGVIRYYEPPDYVPGDICSETIISKNTKILSNTKVIGDIEISESREDGEEWYAVLTKASWDPNAENDQYHAKGHVGNDKVLGGDLEPLMVETQTEFPYTWYFAEGSTGENQQTQFETWISIMNPNNKSAWVELIYMTDKEVIAGSRFDMPARSRKTINIASDRKFQGWSVSTMVRSDLPIVASRSMYWNNRQGGHYSLGTQDIGKKWYVPEGSTKGEFETWILIQNPGNEDAEVSIVYLLDNEEKRGPALTVQAKTRFTINVADSVPDTWSVATEVEADKDIIVESSMYWNGRQGGLGSIGYLVD